MGLYGAVQGVGFRPFVYRLATEMGLGGWVLNSSQGLVVEADGTPDQLERFLARLAAEKPAAALVLAREVSYLAPAGFTRFEIVASDQAVERTAAVLPDLATCPECLAELLDPANRRFEYPFTNCTQCGPRYSIILDIPYDRPRTTMRGFTLCPACLGEYTDPADRRFHAQPNACPKCGPRLTMEIAAAAGEIARGGILALKGIGGFQLLAEDRGREIVVGRAGDGRGSSKLSAEEFKAIHQAPLVKIAMNFRIQEVDAAHCTLSTETRVYAAGPRVVRGFATYWRMIYPGSSLIRHMWLRAIKLRAEAR